MTTDLVRTVEPAALGLASFDPFALMDRLDEEALRKELEGIASTELVYVVKEGGQEVVGLSKGGVDACCMELVRQGQVIREERLEYEVLGEGGDREALFKVFAARYAVSPDGQDVKLDQVIGVKRQPLFYDPVALSLDSKAPSKKYKGLTYRQLLEREDGRDYLAWMAENFNEEEIRTFVRAILAGEEPEITPGRKLNPFWFEAGAMKAARNARFRLIPPTVRAQVIATARGVGATNGRAKHQESQADTTEHLRREEEARRTGDASAQQTESTAAPAVKPGPYAPTEKQVAFFTRLLESSVFTEEERERALEWLGTKATRQTIKDQISWAKDQVQTRRARTDA